MKRFGFCAAVAIFATGCGDGAGGSDGVPITLPDPIVLLSDDFGSGNLNNWTVQSPAGQISAFGNPAPSLLLDGLAGGGGSAVAYSNTSFLATGNLSLSVDVKPGNSNAAVDIVPSPNPASITTFASVVGTEVLYSINGASKRVATPNDGSYHRFTFTISSLGIAWWSRDGLTQFTAPYAAPSTVRLDLRDLSAGDTGSRFDNVLVTLP